MHTFKGFSEKQRQDLQEKSLARLHSHLHNRSVGIMSASRGDLTSSENEARSRQLANDIRGHNLGYVKVQGKTVENKGTAEERPVSETSYLISAPPEQSHKLKSFLTKHGEKYGQDS